MRLTMEYIKEDDGEGYPKKRLSFDLDADITGDDFAEELYNMMIAWGYHPDTVLDSFHGVVEEHTPLEQQAKED